ASHPPHKLGSHHGDTRIIRHAYGEGKHYVPLVLRAQQLWNDLENESNHTLFERTGVLGVGDKSSSFINDTVNSAEQFSLPVETFTSGEIHERWPGITLPKNFVGCYEAASGVLYSEKCIKSYKELAKKHNEIGRAH